MTYLQWWWQGGIYAPGGAGTGTGTGAGAGASGRTRAAAAGPTPAGSVTKNNVVTLPAHHAWWPSRRQPALRGVAVGKPLPAPLAPPRLPMRGLRGGLSEFYRVDIDI